MLIRSVILYTKKIIDSKNKAYKVFETNKNFYILKIKN